MCSIENPLISITPVNSMFMLNPAACEEGPPEEKL
jgi:hypothetical protein